MLPSSRYIERSFEVAECDEPVRTVSCTFDEGGPDCIFVNAAQATLVGNPKAWGYTKDGIQVSNYAIILDGMMPGQKRQHRLVLGGEFKKVTRIVVCSVDPESPLVKGHLRTVTTVKGKGMK
jgi:hypothetical protein